MTRSKTDKRVSVRLDPEASKRLQEAQSKGYTTSRYINDLIKGSSVIDIGQCRQLLPHLSRLNNILEFAENSRETEAIREEVHQLWLCLKSFRETM